MKPLLDINFSGEVSRVARNQTFFCWLNYSFHVIVIRIEKRKTVAAIIVLFEIHWRPVIFPWCARSWSSSSSPPSPPKTWLASASQSGRPASTRRFTQCFGCISSSPAGHTWADGAGTSSFSKTSSYSSPSCGLFTRGEVQVQVRRACDAKQGHLSVSECDSSFTLVVLALGINALSMMLDIIALAVSFPAHPSSTEEFSAVMAIFNLILRWNNYVVSQQRVAVQPYPVLLTAGSFLPTCCTESLDCVTIWTRMWPRNFSQPRTRPRWPRGGLPARPARITTVKANAMIHCGQISSIHQDKAWFKLPMHDDQAFCSPQQLRWPLLLLWLSLL